MDWKVHRPLSNFECELKARSEFNGSDSKSYNEDDEGRLQVRRVLTIPFRRLNRQDKMTEVEFFNLSGSQIVRHQTEDSIWQAKWDRAILFQW
jgi:hypothetical protein